MPDIVIDLVQSDAINATERKEVTRKKMAELYAEFLMSRRRLQIDFAAINQAIMKRWPKGLLWIKTQAWKIAEGRVQPL